jgi:predicted acylesterase/phospholipase RssA
MADTLNQRHAIVLTGTGANAAYEVGVMRAILQGTWGQASNPPVDPQAYCGTSIGAFNAAIMAARAPMGPAAAIDRLRRVWEDRIAVSRAASATGFFRIRAEPTQYFTASLDLASQIEPMVEMTGDALYFMRQTAQRLAYAMGTAGTVADGAATITELSQWIDVSPMYELVDEVVTPSDFGAGSRKIAITAVDWRTGKPRTFRNRDVSRPHGRSVILAAAALPAVFPPVKVDGASYVDASVLIDTPLAPALEDLAGEGDPVLHVVYVDATRTDIPVPAVSNTFATAYRLFMLALSRQVNNDIERADSMNKQLATKRLVERFIARDQAGGPAPSTIDRIGELLGRETALWWQQLTSHFEGKKAVVIHRYRPTRNVYGFDLAQFERRTIRQLIDDGYADAMSHDCVAAGCVGVSRRATAA